MSHDEDQLQPEDTLVDRGVDDVLDEGYSPADRPRHATGFGTTPAEARQEETIEQRIAQEEPDPTSAYGAPENESGLDVPMLGGDDPDAIPAEDDVLGTEANRAGRAGRLVAPDQGLGEDREATLVADDAGIDGGAASAEEAAVHVVDPE